MAVSRVVRVFVFLALFSSHGQEKASSFCLLARSRFSERMSQVANTTHGSCSFSAAYLYASMSNVLREASRGGCVFTSTSVVVGGGGEGAAAFFRLFGSAAVVAFAEEGGRLGCAGERACFCRMSTGFPLEACLRVSNRSGYALTNVNKSLCPYTAGLNGASTCLSAVPRLDSKIHSTPSFWATSS